MADRRYDDKEVGQILKMAAERQSGSIQTGQGMTLAELMKVAAEAGIDPDLIARSAKDLEKPSNGKSRKPDTIFYQETVGGEVTDETWDELVTAMRHHTGKTGETNHNGRSREWKGGALLLTASNRGGETQLQLLDNMSDEVWGYRMLGGILAMFAGLAPIVFETKTHSLTSLETVLMSIFVIAFIVVATAALINNFRRRTGAEVKSLLAKVASIAENGAAQGQPIQVPLAENVLHTEA
jgi:hypothetical protein